MEQRAVLARLIVDGQIVNETKYFFAPFAEIVAQDAEVKWDCRPLAEGRYAVTLVSHRFLWMLHLAEPDGTAYSDSDFDQWPGEPKTVIVTTSAPHFAPVLHWMGKDDEIRTSSSISDKPGVTSMSSPQSQ